MAYMSQDHKKQIAQLLKERLKTIDCNLKYSLAVIDHSEIVCTIQAANINFIENYTCNDAHASLKNNLPKYIEVNHYYLEKDFSGKALEVLQIIRNCLNLNNYDNSDSMIDYFDVGHYISIQVGKWDKPFKLLHN